jgi:DNA integrity scanning protein DisA with diadenylate cyclase activity
MITITRRIEEIIYIDDNELQKRAEEWNMTVEEIVSDLESGELNYDDFVNFSDYTIESQEISVD